MPYGKRRRYYRRRGTRVGAEAATIAREVQKSITNMQREARLEHLTKQGFLNEVSTKAIAGMYAGDEAFKPRRISGFGAYSLGGVGRNIGRLAGAYARGGAMGLAGEALHEVASTSRGGGGGVTKYDWMGSGAYHSVNQLVNPTGPSSTFSGSFNETNDVIIRHREYIQDIIPTSSGFQTQYTAYQNPGLSASFPWLSQLAQYFEEYQFIQLLYTVESMVTEGNTNAQGSVMLCTQYNPTNAPFTSKQVMENYEHSQSFKTTQHAVHGVECDQNKKAGSVAEYIRTGPVPNGQDPKTFDLGLFQVATQGAYPNLNIGELWVTYTVRLSKAKIPPVGTMNLSPTCLNMGSFNAVNTSSMSDIDVLGVLDGGGSPNTPYTVNPNFPFPLSLQPIYDNTNPQAVAGTGFSAGFADQTPYLSPTGHKSTFLFFPTVIEQGNYRLRFICSSSGTQMNDCVGTWEIANGTIVNSYQTSQIAGDPATVTAIGFTLRFTVASPGNTSQCKIWFYTSVPIVSIANQSFYLEQLPVDYTGLN